MAESLHFWVSCGSAEERVDAFFCSIALAPACGPGGRRPSFLGGIRAGGCITSLAEVETTWVGRADRLPDSSASHSRFTVFYDALVSWTINRMHIYV